MADLNVEVINVCSNAVGVIGSATVKNSFPLGMCQRRRSPRTRGFNKCERFAALVSSDGQYHCR